MDSNWYDELVGECKAILTEFGFASRWDKVQMYHELGGRVMAENGSFERKAVYGQEIVKKVSKSIGISERQLQYAIQFYRKFPDLDLLPAGKNISWTKIVREYLPDEPKPPKPPKVNTCPRCGFEY